MSTLTLDLPMGSARPAGTASPRLRLDFLDGLRGLAALYVVIHHSVQLYMTEKATPGPKWFALYPYLIMGEYAVVMFIVLSGYCLMLPVARSDDGMLRGGFVGYMGRRMKRILPAYYVSLALTLLLILTVPGLSRGDGEFWGLAFPLSWKTIGSHLFMAHALRPGWINTINPPMWSIGVEWLNYFLFPLLLLPIWRRFGNLMLIVSATVVSFLPYVIWVALNHPRELTHPGSPIWHPADANMDVGWYTLVWAHPWYVAMFALGMAGAAMQFSPRRSQLDQKLLKLALHPAVTVAVNLFFLIQFIPFQTATHLPRPLQKIWGIHLQRVPMDFIMGGLMILLILHCAHHTFAGSFWRRILQSKPAIFIGDISYSLYLFHVPFLICLHRGLEAMHLGPWGRLIGMTAGGIPLSLLVGTLAYRFFEKPMLSKTNPKAMPSSPARA